MNNDNSQIEVSVEIDESDDDSLNNNNNNNYSQHQQYHNNNNNHSKNQNLNNNNNNNSNDPEITIEEGGGISMNNKNPVLLEFKDINYDVFLKKRHRFKKKKSQEQNKLRILSGISGYGSPGQTLAVMGPSGSGKTTLLNILSQRIPENKIEGQVLVNGKFRTKSFRSASAFVHQESVLLGNITVRETITYSAMLRLPFSVPRKEKKRRVEDVMKELGIMHIADSKVGIPGISRGISGGEMKRVSIGVELVTNPSILFLDEPTSGLDAKTALDVMKTVTRLARGDRTVICTIHQPRSNIFQEFDQLLLLTRGSMAYFGRAKQAVDYFARIGYECPKLFNPADYFIDLITESAVSESERPLNAIVSGNDDGHDDDDDDDKKEEKSRKSKDLRNNKNDNNENDDDEKETKENYEEDSKTTDQNVDQYHHRNNNNNNNNNNETRNQAKQREEENEQSEQQSILPPPLGKEHDEERIQYIIDTFAKVAPEKTSSPPLSETLQSTDIGEMKRFQNNRAIQTFWLTVRASKNVARDRQATWSRFIVNVSIGVLVGLIYLQIGNSQPDIQDRQGALFFILLNQAFGSLQGVLQSFQLERPIFLRERGASMYAVSSYFIAKNIAEIPPLLIFPTIFSTIAYWMIGFQTSVDRFIIFTIISALAAIVANSIGYVLSAAFPQPGIANIVAPLVIIIFVLFGGFYVNQDNLPVFLTWVPYVSFVKYGFEGLVINEFEGLEFTCTPQEEIAGQCPIPDGETVIRNLGMESGSIWRSVGVLIGMAFAYRLLAYLALRFVQKPRV